MNIYKFHMKNVIAYRDTIIDAKADFNKLCPIIIYSKYGRISWLSVNPNILAETVRDIQMKGPEKMSVASILIGTDNTEAFLVITTQNDGKTLYRFEIIEKKDGDISFKNMEFNLSEFNFAQTLKKQNPTDYSSDYNNMYR